MLLDFVSSSAAIIVPDAKIAAAVWDLSRFLVSLQRFLELKFSKYTMNMKRFAGWCCVLAALLFISCGKDDVTGSLAFDKPAAFFSEGDTESVTVHFTASNLDTFSISSKPTGWENIVVNSAAMTVTITPPSTFDGEEAKTGTVTLSGSGRDGAAGSASIFVGVVARQDLSAQRANSYIVSQKETNYLLDVMHRPDDASLATASVGVVWQSASSLIQYVTLDNGKASFYVGADSSDETTIKSGNAVIGAYDASGALLWSWHIWVTTYDPSAAVGQRLFNGYTMMDRNLGALASGNESTDDIRSSYGLYYQWGRKDPFIGPSTYNFANGTAATIYNGSNVSLSAAPVETSSSNGTMDYARLHPQIFLKGVEASEYDWLWSHDAALWTAPGTAKSLYDPCPAGWRVAPAAAFAGLTPEAASLEWANTKYSVTLAKDGVSSLFMGAGQRTYLNGKFQNFYFTDADPLSTRASEAQPWIGLYWTADAATEANLSAAVYFHYGSAEAVEAPYALRRAGGLPVRCVKE